ncbi:hypothetical protein EJ04DRAFT_492078 [Polyplosphaeria fusca]|uniref:Uncharacterized protein n=1 Tax=Polyplosphaeria fusca TaxID=682080 RepID=A0A9P4R1S9_9PLEO|nr:hypothetical protein EJ04DRAFT_492078 [Polyplosphaeria fusca]
MGRKPNSLILTFFERGPKLEDASNRYQHTCKSCGEKFPKGRIDSLTNHLVKKCPALPIRDRQHAVLQLHGLPDLPENMAHMATPPQNGQTMNLPFAPAKQSMSALETLAEVSRQHLDLSGKRVPASKRRKTPPPTNASTAGTHEAFDEFLVDDRIEHPHAMSQSMDVSSAPALPPIYQFNGPVPHSPNSSPHLSSLPLSSSASMAQMVPSLVMAASQANELMPLTNAMTMEPELNMANTGISDKFFHSQGRQPWSNMPQSSIDPLLHDHDHQPHLLPKDDGLNHPRPIAMNPAGGPHTHFTSDFVVGQKVSKPKVRGRFSDSRRKEVQEVRKRGACIRCRMLKKPCSGDSPCNTCVNVESARLWKQPCIRTRVAEEFTVYSAGLHHVLAHHAVNQAKGQIRLDAIPGRIEATHYPESGAFAAFIPLKCQSQPMHSSDIDPAILATMAPSTLEIIDTEDDIGGRLDPYMKKVAPAFLDNEESDFMRHTIRTALAVKTQNQDNLLSKVLELWNLTRILTCQNLDWHIFSNPSLAPSAISPSDLENPARTPITPLNNAASYDLIVTQLKGAVEKMASTLAKTVMNDFERRLLQRQQASPLETFLVAVVLLACVERMCWLFRTWEDVPHASTAPHPSAPDDPLATTNIPPPLLRNPKWPLDKLPAHFSQQGERFSDVVNMLLKMRSVPPKPVPGSTDGVLRIWSDEGGAGGGGGDDEVREWYAKIGVTEQVLAERREAEFRGVSEREWELKFVGKIVGG